MRLIGFSTGALARNDFRRALQMLAERHVRAVELSALRQDELIPLVEVLQPFFGCLTGVVWTIGQPFFHS